MSQRVAVVGGGVSGILCAALLRRSTREVTLVESGPRLGGLLSSVQDAAGQWFDHGTHIPQRIGHPEVDALLFDGMTNPPWQTLEAQRPGNVLCGTLDEASSFPDVRRLGRERHDRAVVELLERPGVPIDARDEEHALDQTFGPTLRTALFDPLLRQCFGLPARELAPGAHRFFLRRVRALTAESTRMLKQVDYLDDRLAFHNIEDAPSTLTAYYPTSGGAGQWIEDLARSALAGVDIRIGEGVDEIVADGSTVRSLRLSSGGEVSVDHVVWTTPVATFLGAAGVAVTGTAPTFLRTVLLHLTFDRPFVTSAHYVTCFDEGASWFRTTLYPNLQSEPTARHCTVEVFVQPGAEPRPDLLLAVVDELKGAGVVASDAALVGSERSDVPGGFPIPTPEFATASQRLMEVAEEHVGNVTFVGRSTGTVFFMADVLRQAYDKVTDLSAVHPS